MATSTLERSPTMETRDNGKEKGTVKDRLLDNAWSQQVKKLLLASVGAVVLAQEEIEEFVQRLVEKGELGVKDGKRLVEETFKSRREQAKKGMDKLEKTIDDRIVKVLDRMNVATKRDVEAIQSTLDRIATQIEKASTKSKTQL